MEGCVEVCVEGCGAWGGEHREGSMEGVRDGAGRVSKRVWYRALPARVGQVLFGLYGVGRGSWARELGDECERTRLKYDTKHFRHRTKGQSTVWLS